MRKKTVLSCVCLFCLGMLLSVSAMAQGSQQGRMSSEERAARMTERYKQELSLTDEQVSKLEAVNKRAAESMQDLRNTESLSREDRMTKMRAIQETRNNEIKAFLTEEQNKQFDAMLQRQQREWGGQSGGRSQRQGTR